MSTEVSGLGLLVRDSRHRRLQPRHVRLQSDGDSVAKTSLNAGANRAQEPCPGGRHAQGDRGDADQTSIMLEHAIAEQLEPQCQQRVGQGVGER